LYGEPAPRWLAADERADAQTHVQHALDAQGRIVIECRSGGREKVCLYAAGQRATVSWDGGYSVDQDHYQDGRLVAYNNRRGDQKLDIHYEYDGDRLQRSVTRHWKKDEPPSPWLSQHVFSYDEDGVLARIDLQYLDDRGQPKPGSDRLEYLRPPKGETLKTIEARVQSLLEPALAAALAKIPRDEKLYALLLCYTNEDMDSAWPPFLVWAPESYRRAVLERGEEVRYYLWAPDEIRSACGDVEHWFDEQPLCDTCLMHHQLMEMEDSDASAMRVLENMMPRLEQMARQAGLPVTDDFVVLYADNTGEVDPLAAMEARLPAGQWALLKQRGYV
jgi:hypothetical protein